MKGDEYGAGGEHSEQHLTHNVYVEEYKPAGSECLLLYPGLVGGPKENPSVKTTMTTVADLFGDFLSQAPDQECTNLKTKFRLTFDEDYASAVQLGITVGVLTMAAAGTGTVAYWSRNAIRNAVGKFGEGVTGCFGTLKNKLSALSSMCTETSEQVQGTGGAEIPSAPPKGDESQIVEETTPPPAYSELDPTTKAPFTVTDEINV